MRIVNKDLYNPNIYRSDSGINVNINGEAVRVSSVSIRNTDNGNFDIDINMREESVWDSHIDRREGITPFSIPRQGNYSSYYYNYILDREESNDNDNMGSK